MPTRRQLLAGGAGLVGLGAVGAAGWEVAPDHLKTRLGLGPDAYIPDAAEGQVRLDRVRSRAMGAEMDLFTAVPAGHGDGAGLPVLVVLHGSSATAAKFRAFGFARFVTRAVEQGASPFVLAGTDDGPSGWVADGSGPDPQRMVTEELPGWLDERGFDADRRLLWGWSRGGFGALRLIEQHPGWSRATALFSPAVQRGDAAFGAVAAVGEQPLGVWCGRQDMFYPAVRSLVTTLPHRPQVVSFSPGAHTRVFWNHHTLAAFSWLTRHL